MICRIVFWLLALLYIAAVGLLLVGTFGPLGSARGALAGVFLVPLGIPWNRLVDLAPQALWPWLAAASPAVNLIIVAAVCRWLRR